MHSDTGRIGDFDQVCQLNRTCSILSFLYQMVDYNYGVNSSSYLAIHLKIIIYFYTKNRAGDYNGVNSLSFHTVHKIFIPTTRV